MSQLFSPLDRSGLGQVPGTVNELLSDVLVVVVFAVVADVAIVTVVVIVVEIAHGTHPASQRFS